MRYGGQPRGSGRLRSEPSVSGNEGLTAHKNQCTQVLGFMTVPRVVALVWGSEMHEGDHVGVLPGSNRGVRSTRRREPAKDRITVPRGRGPLVM